MSVQVKTPTKTQFERVEIQCGEKRESHGDGWKKWKDDSHIGAKFSQPWNRKRRYSQSFRRDDGGNPLRRKRIKSAYFDKPMRFLNGGSIDDPLNLNSLDSSELGKQLNSVTPQSSPLPVAKHQSVRVRIPVNVTDPLNLNENSETSIQKSNKKKRHRHRHKKKDDSSVGPALFSPPKNVAKDKNLMEALRIDIEPERQNITSTPKDNVIQQKPRVVCDKIVSPVIRQTTPKHKKRRSTSEGKPEPSSSASKSLLTSTSSSNSSPKKFKQPRHPSKGKVGKSMQGGQQKFIYGNYNRYYGYRNPAMEPDHRINCFSKHWFEGKCVLDIGCNVGHLTLAIAEKFSPAKVNGIDIDHRLIAAARKNIRYYISSMGQERNRFPISNVLNYGPIEAQPVRQIGQTNFPHNVMFMQGNFVLEHDELLDIQREEHEVIMALSITKWVHFNWGDEGLKRFFKRVYKQLRPGGMFILEPQPWSSYKKKKKLTDDIFKNFQSIKLRPEQFTDYLLSKEVGFSTCKKVDVPMNKSKGFRRPILVFRKSETVQNSPLSVSGSITPPRTSGSLVFPEPSEASQQMSDYTSCSTCSCSSCCSETPRQRDVDEVDIIEDDRKVEKKERKETMDTSDGVKEESATNTDDKVLTGEKVDTQMASESVDTETHKISEDSDKDSPVESTGEVNSKGSTDNGSPKRSVGKDSPKRSVGKDSPKGSIDKDSPVGSTGKDSPKESTGKDGPKGSVDKDSPKVSTDNNSPKESVDKDSLKESTGKDSPKGPTETDSIGQTESKDSNQEDSSLTIDTDKMETDQGSVTEDGCTKIEN